MYMSQARYELIAICMKNIRPDVCKHREAYTQWLNDLKHLANAFKLTNVKFSRTDFLTQAGYYERNSHAQD